MSKRYLRFVLYIFLVGYFSLFFLRYINLVTADLGRHITNGKVFLEQKIVISDNFYSYTQPDFPVVTHHWLSGVAFYLVHSLAGFSGLSLFYILISGLTVFVFFKIAEGKSNLPIALFAALLMIPLLSDRKEIRPEGFSYLLMGLYYYLLSLSVRKKLSFKVLFPLLLVLQILWVNLHLFFFFGLCIVGVFWLWEAVKKWFYKKSNFFKELSALLVSLVLVSLLNPYGVQGLLEPLNILKEYGYMIVENQSVFFMQKRSPDFVYFFFELMALATLIVTIHVLVARKLARYAVSLILAWVFLVLGFRAIRGMQIFGMFFVPLAASYLHTHYGDLRNKFVWPAVLLVAITLIPGHVFSFNKPGAGVGLVDGINGSAEFFKQNDLKGPIFNNYDIGGYLIYHFYGQEPVFVDNRPEAYSVDFFTDLYGPMQDKDDVWREALAKYDFNVIYFYRRDRTQFAQPFLIKRIEDLEWVPVYVDDYVLVLVRNMEENRDVIEKHEIPQELFIVT